MKRLTLGLVLGFLLAGCASFSYRYYGLEVATYEDGWLHGPKEEDDLPLAVCEPRPDHKSPCVVMLSDEFFRLAEDLQTTKQRLKECENN